MNTWLVNSNSNPRSKGPHCYQYMIRQNRVISYYAPFNGKIDVIKKNDLVLLYHNGYGIIAVGFVVKEFVGHDYQKDMGGADEHWADVNWIWKARFGYSSKSDSIESIGSIEPINPINRNDVGITMVNGVVINITDQLDYKKLFEEMAKRQVYM